MNKFDVTVELYDEQEVHTVTADTAAEACAAALKLEQYKGKSAFIFDCELLLATSEELSRNDVKG